MEEFEQKFKDQFDKEKNKIILPESVEKKLNNTYEIIKKENNKNNNSILSKIIKGIIGLLTFGTLSGVVYATVTGNSIWQLFKISDIVDKNLQSAQVISDKIIETDNATVKLNKIACDSSFIIIEYNLNIKDKGLEELKSEKIENEFVLRNAFSLNGKTLNNPYTLEKDNKENYKQYYKKISDNEYIVYDIIDIINENTNEFNLKISPAMLMGGASDGSIGTVPLDLDGNDYFLINIKLTESNKNNIKQYTENNIKVKVGNVISTQSVNFIKVSAEITNLSNKDNKDFNIQAYNNKGKEINSNFIYNKKMIVGKDNLEINLLKNEEQYNIEYENATLKIEGILILDGEINNNEFIKLNINKKINISNISIENNMNFDLNVELTSEMENSEEKTEEITFKEKIFNMENIDNIYNNENMPKFSEKDFEINGIKLGMDKADVYVKLKKLYNSLKININVEDKKTDDETFYEDDYIELSFNENDILVSITIKETNLILNIKNESEFISKYYSDKEWKKLEDYNFTYKILYGYEEFIEKGADAKNCAWIQTSEEDNRDSNITYTSNTGKIVLYLNIITKEIERMELSTEI